MEHRSALLARIRSVRATLATAVESPAADLHHLTHAHAIEVDLDRIVMALAEQCPDEAPPTPRTA